MSHLARRFTDFLVFEIDQNDRVVHLKSLEPPEPSSTLSNDATPRETPAPTLQPQTRPSSDLAPVPGDSVDASDPTVKAQEGYKWSEVFTAALEKFLSPLVMDKLKQMYEEGPEPPFVSDSGWGDRQAKQGESEVADEPPAQTTSGRGRGRGRGGRGGRGRDRGARPGTREDNRKVVTEVRTFSLRIRTAKRGAQPIADKAVRTEFHKAIRHLFKGNLDSETDTTSPNDDSDGSRISVKWVRGGGRRGGKSAGKGMTSIAPQWRLLRSTRR